MSIKIVQKSVAKERASKINLKEKGKGSIDFESPIM